MGFRNDLLNESKNNIGIEINLNEHYQTNKDIIDRYNIKKGKLSYDIDEIKSLWQGLPLGVSKFKELTSFFLKTHNETVMRDIEGKGYNYNLNDFQKELEIDYSEKKEARKAIESGIQKELDNDPSATQRTVASIGAYALSQFTNPYELGLNIAGSTAGTTVVNKLGVTKPLQKFLLESTIQGIEEIGQESIYQLAFEDNFNTGDVVIAGLSGVGINAGMRGIKKGVDLSNKIYENTNLKNVYPDTKNKVMEKIKNYRGDTDNFVLDETAITIQQMEVTDAYTGRNGTAKNIFKESTSINEVTVKEAIESYSEDIGTYFVNDTRFKNINSTEDFIKYTDPSNKEQVFKDIINLLETDVKKPHLPEKVKVALEYYKNIIDDSTLNTVDVDVQKISKDIKKYSETTKKKTDHTPKIERYSIYKNVDNKKIDNIFNEVPHNSNDYLKYNLQKDLMRDLNIPKGATNIKVSGNVPKTKVPVITGTNLDGVAIEGKTKYHHGEPSAVIKYEYQGKTFLHKANFENGEWGADTYISNEISKAKKIKKSNKKSKNTPDKIEIKEPEKKVRKEEHENDMKFFEQLATVEKIIDNKFGTKNILKNAEQLKKAQYDILREVGKISKNKYRVNNLTELINMYKSKYGIDFEIGIKEFSQKGRIGEAFEIKEGENIKRGIYFNSLIDDDDLKAGVFRHEFQHLLDYERNKNFNGRDIYYGALNPNDTIETFVTRANKNHFADFKDKWFELEYIMKYEFEQLQNGNFKESAKILGLDLPKNISEKDVQVLQGIIKAIPTDNVLKAIEKAKIETSKHFNMKKSMQNITRSERTQSQKSNAMKELLETNILVPFEMVEENFKNKLISSFEIEYNGNILNPEKVFDLFEENNENLISHLFFGKEIKSENLKSIMPQVEKMKAEINDLINELAEKTVVDPIDIKLSLAYDRSFVIQKLLGDDAKPFLDGKLDFDEEKFISGIEVPDPLNPDKTVPKRQLKIRNIFVDKFHDLFEGYNSVLEHSLHRKNINPDEVYANFKNATKTMQGTDLENIYVKYKLEKNIKIKSLVESIPDIFTKNNKNIDLEIIKSKKRAVAHFFDSDTSTIKGDDLNAGLGTAVHRVSRFIPYTYSGIIKRENLIKLVMENRIDQRLSAEKIFKEIPIAFAIKETFPKSTNTGFRQLLKSLENSSSSPHIKDLTKEAEKFINANIGQKLGVFTKPVNTTLDKVVKNSLSFFNKINLTGPKAFKEFGQEPIAMSRASQMIYGEGDLLSTYKNIFKAISIIYFEGAELSKINKSLGGKYMNSMPTEFFNVIQDGIDDVTGYRKNKINANGTNLQKSFAFLDKGLNKFNFYGDTQRILKLASFLQAEPIIKKLFTYNNLDDLFSSNSHAVKNLFNDLNINANEFNIMKNILETDSFKERGIFDRIEFENSIDKKLLEKTYLRDFYDDEIEFYIKSLTDKADNLYTKIVKDTSPTEARKSLKHEIDMTEDEMARNFKRIMQNFKNSIQEQWRRMKRDYYLSNVSSETGKFDWGNKIYHQRMVSHILQIGTGLTVINAITDAEFYDDPIEYISDQIDEMVENPTSALWNAVAETTNLWGLTTGASTVKRPIQIMNNVSKGDFDKAGVNLMKMGVNTTNYNIGEKLYELME